MLISTLCPKCQFEHELSDKLLGDTIACQQCGEPFEVVEIIKEEEPAAFEMESIFGSEDDGVEMTPATHPHAAKPGPRFKDGKHALVVPPPPKERWSAESGEDESSQRFRAFRHNSRAVRKFLARDEGSDYSWLLVTGLVLMTLMICTFQGLLSLLIVLW